MQWKQPVYVSKTLNRPVLRLYRCCKVNFDLTGLAGTISLNFVELLRTSLGFYAFLYLLKLDLNWPSAELGTA